MPGCKIQHPGSVLYSLKTYTYLKSQKALYQLFNTQSQLFAYQTIFRKKLIIKF
ncbi:MAG: hypothetical protein PWQ17_990 [Anaerophaga sp.]|nr:hypothetical protein [Anaerophaga sp.]MDN5290737.1 hypothetical protein [Anaerophaga sp.]